MESDRPTGPAGPAGAGAGWFSGQVNDTIGAGQTATIPLTATGLSAGSYLTSAHFDLSSYPSSGSNDFSQHLDGSIGGAQTVELFGAQGDLFGNDLGSVTTAALTEFDATCPNNFSGSVDVQIDANAIEVGQLNN